MHLSCQMMTMAAEPDTGVLTQATERGVSPARAVTINRRNM
jgi:hypothetical protein